MTLDFYKIITKKKRFQGVNLIEVRPKFRVRTSQDFMTKGHDFYACWDPVNNMWTTQEIRVQQLIDFDVWREYEALSRTVSEDDQLVAMTMEDYDNNVWNTFVSYAKRIPDSWHQLDEYLTFKDDVVKKEDYRSIRLPYNLSDGPCPAYEELISTLYAPEERQKLEWAIGSIIAGEGRTIQKFIAMYGDIGTGKSTVINIIKKLFQGYTKTFSANGLGNSNDRFSAEALASNPLVAIQHEGDLSRIDDNTKLNSIVAHEEISIEEKNKPHYNMKFNTFMFIAMNKPVKITDSKSGLIRRLIDVSPTGKTVSPNRYDCLYSQIDFELGAIAQHCLNVYKELGKNYYKDYRPAKMISETDFFYNFMEEKYLEFSKQDGTTAKAAWAMYKDFCEEFGMKKDKMFSYNRFKAELSSYFNNFQERVRINGEQVRCYYSGLRKNKFNINDPNEKSSDISDSNPKLVLKYSKSLLDEMLADQPAQTAVIMDDGGDKPGVKWGNCTTVLRDISTTAIHYVKLPKNHIVIDFDLKDETGNKSMEKNLEAASKWPSTYAEFSKSGKGIHLHYIYDGDPEELSSVYDDGIEIKVFKGDASLRRRLSLCNDTPVAHISTGLPLRNKKPMINFEAVTNEKSIRTAIDLALRKEKPHKYTKPNVLFIKKVLDDAYDAGVHYDVSDLQQAVLNFCMASHNNSAFCVKVFATMKFKSAEPSQAVENEKEKKIVFFDCEVFPNLLLVNWKYEGEGQPVVRMINPSSEDVERLFSMKLVGFNNRRYDNHILYARYLGKSNEEIYNLSKRIVDGDRNAFFGEAYNISYTDVYDFCAKKQGLKKWEIELGIHHQELGFRWDQPVPEDRWIQVAEYCDNDVLATEATFNANKADFNARKTLVEICKALNIQANLNDTTNTLTTKIILREKKNANKEFVYPDLTKLFPGYEYNPYGIDKSRYTGKVVSGKSIYHGVDPGEGGHVYAKPGMYYNVITFDVASMHPSSIIAENGFGPYTENFKLLLDIRLSIKHKDYDKIRNVFGGVLTPYLDDPAQAKALSYALKIAINSVYGLTAAAFDNPLRDPRNVDNWVAKRGALFMCDLHEKVKAMGAEVVHIKTDSIKIVNPSKEVSDFVFEFGKKYGYTFEIEEVYTRFCLVNDSVYIAKKHPDYWDEKSHDKEHKGWSATGAQFQVPCVFKTLFTKEPLEFKDYCETKSVTTSLYLDMNEKCPDVTAQEKKIKQIESDISKLNEQRKLIRDLQTKLSELQCRRDDLAADINMNPQKKDEAIHSVDLMIDDTDEKLTAIDPFCNNIDKIDEKLDHLAKENEQLKSDISKGHNYQFIGRAGQFCPVVDGIGGGHLVRVDSNGTSYSAVPGSKKPGKVEPGEDPQYRWLESETVKMLKLEDKINKDYYIPFIDSARDAVSQFGDFDAFVSD